ncbi:DNA (Cytosine-5-)-methyltransferase domain protein [Ralstonia insidiosa]|uniref:DNA (Cytosine-5-)-methyltransferase domain protein n=1 Tax=Ralstonia insidiosa TaxID=190721 RepID=A0AAC9FPT9_9RALS|nr:MULTISPECIES: hypothetical protein [Ralstonia]ANH71867.1 DNA (Cytosine-5-)-methyltransferase domain protein [Ralstonia insidiosa]EPX95253.1 hypothetical protein C404_22990 [Ralstonia sp. AU12-08]MBY4707883.1 hypothetical protein [Ralstonia insidiosa]GAQ28430.1 hypothetical protein SAMD00023378_2113 [Ralstonia sp. NT80]
MAFEDVQVGKMPKSAAGSAVEPGKNARAQSGLNKSVLNKVWFEFGR